jgi:hypothetical protein
MGTREGAIRITWTTEFCISAPLGARLKEQQMRCIQTLSIAAMASAVLLTMAGTASATTFTSPKGTTYTSTVKAEAESTVTLTSAFGGFGAISCKKSVFAFKVEQHGVGPTIKGNDLEMSLGDCPNQVTIIAPGFSEIHWTNENEADWTAAGWLFTFHGTLFGTCQFGTSATGTNLGTLTMTPKTGGNATLDVKASIPSINGCGTGTLEGSYKVVTPSTLYGDA